MLRALLLLAAGFAAMYAAAQSLPGENNACMPPPGNGQGNWCTARDLRVSGSVVSGPASCELGETITLTFQATLGSAVRAAAERYKVGFFIGERGGLAIDPAPGGTCTASYLTPNSGAPDISSGVGPYRELSQTPDACGDVDGSEVTVHNITSSQILCRDNDGDGRLDISAAVTWDNQRQTSCSSPPVISDFFPDQSSKCLSEVNLGFDIPVEAPPAIEVEKTAIPEVLEAPGGEVAYDVTITNVSGVTDTVIIDSVLDDRFGDLNGRGNCSFPVTLPPGTSRVCRFLETLNGQAGDTHVNVVSVSGRDEEGSAVSGSDDAVVTFVAGAPPLADMQVEKSASPGSLFEPGGDVDYTIVVTNTGEDTLRLDTLLDDQVGGSLNGVGDCLLPAAIPAGGFYSCSYDLPVTGEAGDVIVNTVTATSIPISNPGNPITESASAEVTILDVASNLRIVKTPFPREVADPGPGLTTVIDYRLVLLNLSTVDDIAITSLIDIQQEGANPPSAPVDVLSLPTPAGRDACTLPQTLQAGSFGRAYACWFSREISGDNVDDGDIVSNTVNALGTDDDGVPVDVSDGAQVRIVAAPVGTIDVIKTASPTSVTPESPQVTYTVEVINTGSTEVVINSLTDQIEGGPEFDITDPGNVNSTTCTLPQTLDPTESYTCEFAVDVTGDVGEGVTDIVVASGSDAAGNDVAADDSATVAIAPADLAIRVIKSAAPNLAAFDQEVVFTIEVQNSGAQPLFLSSLDDTVFGELDGVGDCAVPQLLGVAEVYTCTFSSTVDGGVIGLHINTVTATGEQASRIGNASGIYSVSDSDSAYVLTLRLPTMEDIRAVPVPIWVTLLSGLSVLLVVRRRMSRRPWFMGDSQP
jgi:hypothetical protein